MHGENPRVQCIIGTARCTLHASSCKLVGAPLLSSPLLVRLALARLLSLLLLLTQSVKIKIVAAINTNPTVNNVGTNVF